MGFAGKGDTVSIRAFILGVVLLALVGWCMVQESIAQTQARYRLAELARREDELRKRLAKLRTAEESLKRPARLTALIRERKMDLVSLGSAEPRVAEAAGAKGGAAGHPRLPGEVLDEEFMKREQPVRMATAGNHWR